MATKAPKAARQLSSGVQTVRMLLRPQVRGPALTALVVLASIVGLNMAWNEWGAPATLSAEYVVTPQNIAITPQPAWIHADVKAEVVQAANLNRLDVRDVKLVEEISRAFALHAWVAKVGRVKKQFPAQVHVELEYRRPVAAVEINDRGQPGLLFVDAQGVLLPSADFASNQGKNYLRIAVGKTSPAGYGMPWGDEDQGVAGAARIAAAWGDRFQAAGLYRIVAAGGSGDQLNYELRTTGETRVVWGAAPARESAAEPSAEQKIAALLAYIADKGSLDRPTGERLIDLRILAAGESN